MLKLGTYTASTAKTKKLMATPKFTHMLGQLLSTNSISSFDEHWDNGNLAVINTLAEWLEALGFKCEIQPLPSHPSKANLIATIGAGDGGLVLAGHTDTVPFDDNGWDYPALGVTEADDRFYGLGSCDMKGFFAIVIDALKEVDLNALQQPIIIVATADEESSMAGAEALAAAGKLQGRVAVIGEPTGLKPIISHKSITMQRVSITGQSGHSSNPALGKSALEVMHELIGELMSYRQNLQQQHNKAFEVSTATMNLGCIHGGDNANRICGQCQLDFDLRLLPGMSNQKTLADIQNIMRVVQQRHDVGISMEPLFKGVEPFNQAKESEFVKTVERLTNAESGSVGFATEAPYFQAMGFDTIVIGPGSIDQAHQPNEFLPHDAIKPAQELIHSLIKQYCS